ncbi:MAG: PAS domain-containing protein [Candidatus Velthaea sp.]
MSEAARLWRLTDVAPERLDDLPFGAVIIDYDGTIVGYNEYEARLAHKDREAVIGLNFFRDVAPCTGVQAFEGRMREFLKLPDHVSESFDYFFPFIHGSVEVSITFIKLAGKKQILIAVERVDRKKKPIEA